MNYNTLVGTIIEYIHISAIELSKWLEMRLPKVLGKHWWCDGVIGKLSDNQRSLVISKNLDSLAKLDPSALLRVADKNWYTLQSRYHLTMSERTTIKRMVTVRNNWAHAPTTPPSINLIVDDLKTLEDFMGFVEVERKRLWALGRLISDIESNGLDSTVLDAPVMEAPKAVPAQTDAPAISINSIVRLASDHHALGIVVGIDKVANTTRYKVFIGDKLREFFEGQVEPGETTDTINFCDVSEVQCILTAHQINKPSSESLYSLNAARIDFVPYQFRPALKLIKSDIPRLLIADSVGVGKTIEAGLLLKEMQARTALDSVLIICPKPLVAERKWEIEMKRFDEDFTAVDGSLLRHIISEIDRDGELPDKYKRIIMPYSLLTEELLTGNKGRGLPGLINLDPRPFFDMVIVDEAHHIRNRSTQAYKAVQFFCENANAVVFLTATPLQLGNSDLYTLLNLLQPDTVIDMTAFRSMAEPNEFINEALRNLRVQKHESKALAALQSAKITDWGRTVTALNPAFQQAVATLSGGEISREQRVKLIGEIESLHSFAGMITRTRRQDIEDFCVRRAYTLQSKFTGRQRELHDELLSFISAVYSITHPTIPIKFLMCTLRRQASSCIFGLAPFIKDIIAHGMESLVDDYEIQDELGGEKIVFKNFSDMAEHIIELADNLPSEDSKFDGLAEIIRERQSRENKKIIIFSTFRHTLKYLLQRINAMNGVRAAYVDGSVKDDERYALRERFALPDNDARSLDILLFTEVGSEGLDYQFCDTIINYDLPWNPMRVEQRIGRIDRRGQKSDVAHIYNCFTQGTIDEEIHDRCLKRIGVFERSIGDCSDILGDITKSIQDIIFDEHLTAEERAVKLEQMADNEIRKVQEMQRLEDDAKHMFGLDISNYTEDVDKADNPWLSAEAIKRMVYGYLEERLGNNKSRLTNNKIKLTAEEKAVLADDYRRLGKTGSDSVWLKYLRSSAPVCGIAYNHDAAKDPKTLFLTPVHPLVRLAANYYASDKQLTTALEVSSSEMAPGSYPFQFYIWEYTGERPRTQLLSICENAEVQRELSTIMQGAVSTREKTENAKTEWDKLAKEHLLYWKAERDKYRIEVQALCRFKKESLAKSVQARKNIALRQMNETKSRQIIQMRQGEIERLDNEFASKAKRLEQNAQLADIHTSLIVNGVLIVREG